MATPTKPRIKRRRRNSTSPNSPPPKPPPHDDMDLLLQSALAAPESSTSTASLSLSFDRILDSLPCDSDKADFIQRALRLGSTIIEAAKLSDRNLAAMHNLVVWYLPSEITIHIFSMIDTVSLCNAAATCSIFRKCAEAPTCYTDLDLTRNQDVDDAVLLTMIQRAGTSLQSLKLGPVTHPITFDRPLQSSVFSGISWNDMLTRQSALSHVLSAYCLTCLSAPGSLLKRLHLYNIDGVGNSVLNSALSACPSLIEIGIVGLHHVSARQTLESISTYCPLIELLFFESSAMGLGTDNSLKLSTCSDLVINFPKMSYLALRGFRLHDYHAREFVKGFHQLKHVDFSASSLMTGAFLKGLGGSAGGSQLEVLVLRDCIHLKNVEVTQFLSTILAGDFKHLEYFDISNRKGLASESNGSQASLRCFNTSFIPWDQLREVRPELCLVAEFPACASGQANAVHQPSSSDETSSSDDSSDSTSSDSSY